MLKAVSTKIDKTRTRRWWLVTIVLLGIFVLVYGNYSMSQDKKIDKGMQVHLANTRAIINLGETVLEVPFYNRSFWVPAKYMETINHVLGDAMFGSAWKDGMRSTLILDLIWPEFEGLNEDNKLYFRTLNFPEKELNIFIHSNGPGKFQIERHEVLTNRLFGERGDLNEKNRYRGSLQDMRLMVPKDKDEPWGAHYIPEEKPDEVRNSYDVFTEKGQRYGLHWVGERYPIVILENGNKYHSARMSMSLQPGKSGNDAVGYEDDLYYSRGEDGEVARIITCPPDEKKHKPGFVPYCTHHILYPPLDVKIKISYYRDSFPHWREIEDKVRALVDSFLVKPEDKIIVHASDRKRLIQLMRGDE